MRQTFIRKLEVERHADYDPDYHGLIDYDVDIRLEAKQCTPTTADFDFNAGFQFIDRKTEEKVGRLQVEATIRIQDTEIPLAEDGSFDVDKAPENLKRLVEGAVGEDLFLLLSLVSRRARLPSLIPSPLIFHREGMHHDGEEE